MAASHLGCTREQAQGPRLVLFTPYVIQGLDPATTCKQSCLSPFDSKEGNRGLALIFLDFEIQSGVSSTVLD